MNGLYIPLGPVDDFPVIDDFVYEEVRESHCVATVATEVCKYLVEKAELEGKKYLPVCIPCYNEDFLELLKTLVSLMENFEFMQKKARLHDDSAGRALKNEFNATIPVIVPIFDGTKALSPTMKEWINANFPLLLNEMEGNSEPGKIDVRISCSKWWYFCEDTLPPEPGVPTSALQQQHQDEEGMGSPDNENLHRIANQHRMLNADGTYRGLGLFDKAGDRPLEDDDKILYFYMCPIVKRQNHRKHNSHQWFFDSICEGLEDRSTYAFLTDCGTSYEVTCISRLMYDIFFKTDLIGVTARQRVETPNNYFHPCEDSPYYLLQGDHTGKDQRPCWKCWANYVMSPCPLQGFEFEATLILNSAMFNLVEALPVMPGPCQLLHWQKMKEFKVVDEYFNLLFEGEAQKKLPSNLHKSLKRMKSSKMEVVNPQESAVVESSGYGQLSFTEFLRVNMRLAEDRILSFVCVFSTGYGTKWVPGATFYYQPEVQWSTLLTQRRRWLNGTFASFLFFFVSERARARIHGGMFDQHKAGKNIRFVNLLWSLQLFQLILVIIAPAVFGSAGYIGLMESGKKWPAVYGWADTPVYKIDDHNTIAIAEVWCAGFFVTYAVWTMMSYFADRGKMSELLCRFISIAGFVYMFPVYFAIWYSIITQGPDVVGGLVICGILLPIGIAVAESFESAFLYLLYLPWFMVLIIFFLVFVPGYSFARLWDTTWGNRATGKDSAINEGAERTMKFRNVIFSSSLVVLNVFLVWAFIQLFKLGYAYVIGFMFVVFCPVIIQLICAIVFLFIVLPMRNFYKRPDENMLLASGSGDFSEKGSVASKGDYGMTLVDNNSIPANKYASKSYNRNANVYDNEGEATPSDNSSINDSIDHRISSV